MLPALLLAAGYLAGAVPTGVVVARALGLPDPRTYGSGNIGATNVARAGGVRAAALTLAGDAAKGALPVLLARSCAAGLWVEAATALAAIVGHVFPITLGGEGGKGVATAFGVFLALAPLPALAAAVVYVAVALATRTSSLGSLAATASLPAALAWVGAPAPLWALCATVVAVILVRHRDNLRRLRAGAELGVLP